MTLTPASRITSSTTHPRNFRKTAAAHEFTGEPSYHRVKLSLDGVTTHGPWRDTLERAQQDLAGLTGSSVNKKLQLKQLKAAAGDRRGGRVRERPPDGPEPVRRP